MTNTKCNHCKGDIAIRNPKGFCDHLYYPENCEVCRRDTKMKPDWMTEWKQIRDSGVDAPMSEFYDKVEALLFKQEEQYKAEMEAVQKIDWDIDVRYEKDLVTAFNKFIKKWCGSHYAHLIDDDEQDGQYIRDKIEKLKQQHRKELEGLVKEIEYAGLVANGKGIVIPTYEWMKIKKNLLKQKGE